MHRRSTPHRAATRCVGCLGSPSPTSRSTRRAALGAVLLATLVSAWPAAVESVGFLKFETWSGLSTTDNSIDNTLLVDPRYPNQPTFVSYAAGFTSRPVYPDDSHEGYGGRMSGWITPLESGDYRFFIYSDDSSRLFISTDDNPANIGFSPIAEEPGCCNIFAEPDFTHTRTSEPISLVAGRKYYLEVIWKEGNGGDYCHVAWRKEGDPTPAASLTPIAGVYLSSMAESAGASVTITAQPQNATAAENAPASFSVSAQAQTPFQQDPAATLAPLYQWFKNGAPIANATAATYTIPLAKKADHQARFTCLVAVPGASQTSDAAVLTVTDDVTPPTIVSVEASVGFTEVTVTFSEPVAAASAQATANYQINGLTVSSATLSPAPNDNRVLLVTSRQTEGTDYTLSVQNVLDTAGNPTPTGASAAFTAFAKTRGGLRIEIFAGITGTAVQALLDSQKYQDNTPDTTGYVTEFSSRPLLPNNESGLAARENYGGRLIGWIVPPESGDYEFFLRSDDASQLYLSLDDNPENATLIAEETGCCGAFEEPGLPETSLPQSLILNQRYAIYAVWKEGGGGDYCDVAWRKVGDTTPPRSLTYIPGTVLEAYANAQTFIPPTITLTAPADGSTFETNQPVVLTATATAAGTKQIRKVEFFDGATKVGEVASSPYTMTLTGLSEDPHRFTARATDSAGLAAETTPITVNIGSRSAVLLVANIDASAGDVTSWRYDRSGRDLGTAWREKDYDDSQWPEGPALIADETTTTVEPIRTAISRLNDNGEYVRTFYFRKRFTYNFKVNPLVRVRLRHVVDDGVVFYLNGREIHRFGITADPVDYLSDAAGHENAYEGPYDIPSSYLVEGDNILAAEVHQSGGSSSDMVFGGEFAIVVPLVQKQLEVVKVDDLTTWRYDRSGMDLGTEWRMPAFNDSQWPEGKALIADETTTTVEPIRTPISRFNDNGEYVRTFYFRTRFNLPIASTAGTKLRLRHVVDDGVIFYLNGFEINRLGITADPVDYLSDAAGHENAWEGPFDIPIDHLQPGDNVLAAELHQSGGSSSDMVFGGELIASAWVQREEGDVTAPEFSRISLSGGNVVIEWTGAAALWSAEAVTGPWSPVDNATSPYSTPATGAMRWFRLQQ